LLKAIQERKDQAELAAQYDQLQRQLAGMNIAPQPSQGGGVGKQGSGKQGSGKQGSGKQGSGKQSSGKQGQGAGQGGKPGSFGGAGSGGGGSTEPQFQYAGQNVNAQLRHVIDMLQTKIQAAILLTARMDADEPVPAKYRGLVDEYYQALSDDLR